ncbi:hypothetical protein FS935_17635 [Metabacillus litoralis]|uniref:Uncharacterized protein n=1 Tax=Metabacillus litoralis TaxID=152268 RepID=A0A5C6VXU6_9BACI|nr:hypothetical protein [Metabacillus litoralis]TXC89296.1 hypothetical protein FS935_17635 [Metabacillus litoralis]
MNLTYEYSYSLKILNNLVSQTTKEINVTIDSINKTMNLIEIKNLNNTQLKTSFQDLLNLKSQSMKLICSEDVDRELIINIVSSIVLIISEMIKYIEDVKVMLNNLDITMNSKITTSYELEYLTYLLEDFIR